MIANSIDRYDDGLSRLLTERTVHANLQMREMGFKPYVAPALSSGALSLLLCLRGQWHCSSTYLDGVFMGARNRVLPTGTELERLPLPQALRDKTELLCNECCAFGCRDRAACYRSVSRENLGLEGPVHRCTAPDAAGGYRFSQAMENPGFIGVNDIRDVYLPMGFSQFKIEGRSLGTALLLEFLLHYLTRPEYHIHVREALYLDNTLDLF